MASLHSGPVAVVAARNLHKTYRAGQPEILRGISLDVRPGEMLAIVGPSGSGKSTLLSCLSGLEAVSAGEIDLVGIPIDRRDMPARLRARELGFVFQDYALLDFLTVQENILLASSHAGMMSSGFSVLPELLHQLGLEGQARRAVTELSGGQQQRVSLARAMINHPRVIFADEPTGALDGTNSRIVIDTLRDACHSGSAVVLVTHDLEIASQADRAIVLVAGEIHHEVVSPTPDQLVRFMRKLAPAGEAGDAGLDGGTHV